MPEDRAAAEAAAEALPQRREARLKAASIAAELVFHGLAFVPVSRLAPPAAAAASLSWPAYVAFAKRAMPEAAWRPFEEDAPLLSRLFEQVEVAHGISWLADLFDDLDALLGRASVTVRAIDSADVRSVDALRALQALPVEPIEIMRADLALAAEAFRAAHASLLSPHSQKFLEALSAWLDETATFEGRGVIEAAHFATTLGPRGRGFPSRTFVGTSSLPGGVERQAQLDTDSALVLAAHEAAVHAAQRALSSAGLHPTWSDVEPVALAAARDWLSETALAPAHRAWSASLDRSGLAELTPVLRAAAVQAAAALRA